MMGMGVSLRGKCLNCDLYDICDADFCALCGSQGERFRNIPRSSKQQMGRLISSKSIALSRFTP